jgi:hypothetical protein
MSIPVSDALPHTVPKNRPGAHDAAARASAASVHSIIVIAMAALSGLVDVTGAVLRGTIPALMRVAMRDADRHGMIARCALLLPATPHPRPPGVR